MWTPEQQNQVDYWNAHITPSPHASSMNDEQKRVYSGLSAEGKRYVDAMKKIQGSAAGKVVQGPAISQVGERGIEYALLPPGAVIAPKPKGQKPSMEGALRAIAAQLMKSGRMGKSGMQGMSTGGTTLPKSILEAPALQAFMYPGQYKPLSTLHNTNALFHPFGSSVEAPNWLDPRTILAYTHADPTERKTMESVTSAFGWEPATALDMGQRVMAGFGSPVSPYQSRYKSFGGSSW
jgi:hypothetical protein